MSLLQLQRSAGNASVSAMLGLVRGAGRNTPGGQALQRYVQAANTAILSGQAEFEAQTVDTHNRRIDAPTAPGGAGLPAGLRASNDGNMAIEDSDLTGRQPKVFYATAGVRNTSNHALAAVGSDYELYADRANAIRVTLPDHTTHDLDRILPRTRVGTGVARRADQEGLTLSVDQDCIMVARAVMKHANSRRQAHTQTALPDATFPEVRLAEYMAAWVAETQVRQARTGWQTFWNWYSSASDVALAAFTRNVTVDQTFLDNVATGYANILNTQPALASQVAQDLGVNLHAAPNVGEAYETMRVGVGAPPTMTGGTRNFWGQHIGGVVAASGADRVTLENYARSHEIGSMRSGGDYYFQMYSTTAGQTWHEFWTSQAITRGAPPVGQNVHEALTMVIRSG